MSINEALVNDLVLTIVNTGSWYPMMQRAQRLTLASIGAGIDDPAITCMHFRAVVTMGCAQQRSVWGRDVGAPERLAVGMELAGMVHHAPEDYSHLADPREVA